MDGFDQIRRFLEDQSHLCLGEPRSALNVVLKRKGGAGIARVDFERSTYRVVVKPIPNNAYIPSVSLLCDIHNRVRAQRASIAEALPGFLGFDGGRLVMLEYIAGPTLADVLTSRWRTRADDPLATAARTLSDLNRVAAVDVGLPAHMARSNGTYVVQLRRMWNASYVSHLLDARYRTPDPLLSRLPAAFDARTGTSLLLHDSQPKNVIVAAGGHVVFVDIDYSLGNAAINVAGFLAGLDRLGLARAWPGARQIRRYKRLFLEAYREGTPGEVLEDVVFFYPWALLQLFEWHAASRPAFRWYLARYYGARINEFLLAVDRCRAASFEWPERLFPT